MYYFKVLKINEILSIYENILLQNECIRIIRFELSFMELSYLFVQDSNLGLYEIQETNKNHLYI